MTALSAMTAHEVMRDLGTMVPVTRLSPATLFPIATPARASNSEPGVFTQLVRELKRRYVELQLTAQLEGMSDHLLNDIGMERRLLRVDASSRVNLAQQIKPGCFAL